MPVLVEPGNERSTHHLSLTDGLHIVGLNACDSQGNANPLAITRTPVPRTAFKTSSGDQKYSDFEPPWSPISQNSWLGGRGLDDAEADATRYLDGYCANTSFGTAINGPQLQYSTGYRKTEDIVPGNVTFVGIMDDKVHTARLFQAGNTATMISVAVLLRRKGSPANALTINLRANAAGVPSTILATATVAIADIVDTTSEVRYATLSVAVALTAATYYWLEVTSAAGTSIDHWEVGCLQAIAKSSSYLTSLDGATWVNADVGLYFRLADAPSVGSWHLMQFRSLMYAYFNQDGAAPKVYKNGDRGMVTSGNGGDLTKLNDSTKTWLTNQWVGCVVKLIAGTGAGEQQGWRTIVSNTGTQLNVSPAWQIVQDTTTEYVIVGSNRWTEVTGHGLTAPITDVCIVGDICYLAQGDAVNIIRMHINATGAHEWAADGTNKAVFLCLETNTNVWRGNNAGGYKIASAPKQTVWNNNLVFGTDIVLSDDYGRITNLLEYNDKLWIMREGMVFWNNAGTITAIHLEEMRTVMAHTNGRAALTHNVYLYFAVGGGLERYYSSALDDVGPDRDKGLPSNRKGVVSSMVGYPGRFFVAYDAGAGYSSILQHNGSGWHEMYRAPLGQVISDMAFEVIPGTSLDRLWVAQGFDLTWLPFPSGGLNPRNDPAFLYAPEACITSGYFYAGLYDAIKYIHSIKLFSENLAPNVCYIEVEYQLDDATTWQPLDDIYTVSPIDEVLINPHTLLGGATGRRIRYRVHMFTTDALKSPELRGVVLEAITRVPIKYSYALPYRIIHDDTNATREQLESWARELTPLTMRSIYKAYDNKTVFIDPAPSRPYQQKQEGYIETMTIIEV